MLKNLLRISFSCLIILYLGLKVDWSIVFDAFQHTKVFYYLLSTIIALVCPVILACKYYLFIKNTQLYLSLKRLICINLISRFYALFIPTAVGPEFVRWYKITDNKKGRSFFLASTMVERLFFVLILLLFGSIPLMFYTENSQIVTLRQNLIPLLAISYILLASALTYFIFPGFQKISNRIIRKCVQIKKNSKIDRFLKNFSLKNSSISVISALIALSLFWQIFFLTRIYFLFVAMDLPFTVIDVTWMGSLVLLLQVLPVSFAGIGVREGAYAYIFTLFDLPSEQGFLVGILLFTQMLIFAGIGAILNLYEN